MLYAKQDVLKIHTIESCKEIAHKYKTKIEWKKKDILSFLHSFYCDWHKECSIHFEEPKKPKLRKTYIRKSYQNK
jgi:hypothetical protein